MGDITTREEASTNLKRDWFYKNKDVARPILTYNELREIERLIKGFQHNTGFFNANLYSKIVRAIHLIEERKVKELEERRIKGDKK